ncbi:MAG: LysR family transcriptional regulator [Gammaproteobacteria bacterium]|nr:LysR family transcriptional regulator [Gammaproteobacteria bacterium]
MRLSELQHFIDVAEYGSLTHAAEVRGMSQPGMSRIVRELEKQVGSALLRRTGRGIELTAAGDLFLDFARNTVTAYAQARHDIAALSLQRPAHLRIAIPIGTGGLLAPDLQRRFALQLPQIAIDVFEERTARATDAMLMRRYDAVLTYGYDEMPPTNGEDLYQEDLYLVGVGDLAGTDGEQVLLEEAALRPLLLPPAGRYRALIDQSFAGAGLRPEVAREFETSEAMLAYVMEREGVAILPFSDVVASHDQSRLGTRAIVEPGITRRVRLLFDPAQRSATYQSMLQVVRATLADIAARVRWRPLAPR